MQYIQLCMQDEDYYISVCLAKSNARRDQMCKIIATSMEERSKRLQHLLKRSEEMQVLHQSINKKHSMPTDAVDLFSSLGSSMITREQAQSDRHSIPNLDFHRRSLSAGKIAPTYGVHRRFSSYTAPEDTSSSFTQLHSRFASIELPTASTSNLNLLGLHRMSRDDSDADVESLCSTTDTKHLFTKRISATSIDSNSLSRAQSNSPTNHGQLQFTNKPSLQLSDNERYLSDDEAYKRRRFSLASLRYFNAVEPGKNLISMYSYAYLRNCLQKRDLLWNLD